ncbi:MAG: YhbY family RNA-binding protein [Clostridia bacterium]|nr:YhbY family RNA-binding protein [Clostridia bacterium]
MITTKQRAYLRSMANTLPALYIAGKGEVTENQLQTFADGLEKKEIIKISVLETSPYTPRELCDILVSELNAEPVQVIDRKIVLYKQAKNKDNRKIVLPVK